MNKLSRVLIVGQPNVGKSVLFNRLSHSNQAITSPVAHTTRDQNRAICKHSGVQFELVDSAGFAKSDEELSKLAIAGLEQLIKSADLVLLVVDGSSEINNNDLKLAKLIRSTKKSVWLICNKSDKKDFNNNQNYFRRLGFEAILNISAQNGQGASELLGEIVANIPRKKLDKDQESIKIALLGRPNTGKSALLNALAKEKLALVSDIAGTTRDVNSVQITYKANAIDLYDTAGLRRRGKIGRGIEYFSASRTRKAIENADICLVLVDANSLLTKQDEHIIGLVKEARKPLVVVVSKWDDIEDKTENTMQQMANNISAQLQYVWWAPIIFTSAQNGQNLEKLKQIIIDVGSKLNTKLPTTKLNKVLREAANKQPPVTTKSHHAKLNYITQTGNNPLQLTVFGTHPKLIHFSYQRYLENQLRANFDLNGIPLQIVFASKYKEEVRRTKK